MTHMKLGEVELDLVLDAVGEIEGDSVFSPATREEWAKLAQPNEEWMIDVAVRPLLIQDMDGYTLIDTGYGTVKSEPESQTGNTLSELAARSIDPGDIRRIIITHAHGDHCWGNCVLKGETWVPAFPNAEYIVQSAELDFLKQEDPATWTTRFEPIEKNGHLRLIDGDTKLSNTVECLLTRGHTIAHQSVLVSSGGKSALYVADQYISTGNVTNPEWGPDWAWSRDDDIENRKKTTSWAIDAKAVLIIGHDPANPFVTVQKADGKVIVL